MALLSDRSITVTTPLPEGALLFERMAGREALGRPFEYQVDLLGKSSDIDVSALLGKPMTVDLLLTPITKRHFNGIVARFAQVGWDGDLVRYRAILRPWLWLLTRTSNCRIFQHGKTVPEIIQQVFRDAGFSDFDASRLSGTYRKWDYLVQYRETDFNFVSRIMEQEGIYYYFTHDADKHTMVLADSHGSHDKTPGYEVVPFIPPDTASSVVRERDHIDSWSFYRQVTPGKMFVDDFNFESPRGDRKSTASAPLAGAYGEFEIYDYPGEFKDRAEGNVEAKIRLEARQTEYEVFEGEGDARGLSPGALFMLSGYFRVDQEKEYLITSASYALVTNAYGSTGGGGDGVDYRITFSALDGQRPFRASSTTPKPTVQGPQTAIVVGQKGEEIWTDKYGRVKVQFHWDRYGTSNEDSSCWVRVAQIWAGAKWGGMHIPRIGQEVIVDFLEGDPDRPIVTGRVYNADNMPPYDLPANQTQSGIKSRSSKGGGPSNFNEIRFEDKKGSEELFVQAEKDHNINVKNNQGLTVGASRAKTVGKDEKSDIGTTRTETVGTDESVTIGANQTLAVGASRTKTVAVDETVTIGSASTESIGATRTVTIGAAYQITVGGIMNETVVGAKTEEVGAAKMVTVAGVSVEGVGGGKTITAGGAVSIKAGKDMAATAAKNFSASAGDDVAISAGKSAVINAADQLTLKCGDATIVLKKNGDISIKGKKISIDGSGDVVIKGKKISQN